MSSRPHQHVVPQRGPSEQTGTTPDPSVVDRARRLARALRQVASAAAEQVPSVVAAAALDLVGGDTAVVGTVDAADGEAVARAVVGDPQVGPRPGSRLDLRTSLLGVVVRTRRAELCRDTVADPRTLTARNRGLRIGSSVVVPLVVDDEVVGCVTVLAEVPGTFDEQDLEWLVCLAESATGRLHQVRWAADEAELRRTVVETLEEGVLVTRGHRHEVVLRNGVATELLGLPDVLAETPPLARMTHRLVRADGSVCRFDDLPPVRAGRLAQPVAAEVYRVARTDEETSPARSHGTWVRVTSVPTVDPLTLRATQVVTRVVDITAERRSRRAAEAGAERMRTVQALTGLGWWELDAVLGRWTFSPDVLAMLGLDPASGPLPSSDVVPLLVPVDGGGPGATGPLHRELETGARIYRVRRPDGQERRLQVWIERDVAADGLLLRLHGVAVDVTEREHAVSALAAREDHFRLAVDRSPIGMAMVDLDARRLVRVNPALVRMLGHDDEAEVLARGAEELLGDDDATTDLREPPGPGGGLPAGRRLRRLTRRDGLVVTALVTSSVTTDSAGRLLLLSHVHDVTEQQRAQESTADSELMFRGAFENAPWGMALLTGEPGGDGVVVRANQALADIVQRPLQQVVGSSAQEFLQPQDQAASRASVAAVGRTGEPVVRTPRRFLRPDGSVVHTWVSTSRVGVGVADQGGHPLLLAHVVDVTAQREHQRVLERMAMTDPVTALANRTKLAARMERALGLGRRVAVLLLDLDRFKTVNDSLGHQAGDLLLVEVAERLRSLAQPGWTVARLGGDEFVVMAEDVAPEGPGDADVLWITERLLAELSAPFVLDGSHTVSSSASVGVAFSSPGACTADDLLRQADMALYAAKDAGRNRYVVCDRALLETASRRLDTEQRLRTALAQGRLRVHLQPIIDLRTGRTRAHEALVRLEDPELGLLGPDVFIDVAEETELVTELDAWVLGSCCARLAREPGLLRDDDSYLSVNVSGRSLARPGFAAHLRRCLDAHEVPGRRLLVEITESTLLDDDPAVLTSLADIRATGARLGIDDFGTGYSALAYLQRFDLDVLKIDKSFVAPVHAQGDRAAATVAAIVDLAHAHEMTVIAEGVETQEQAALLRTVGCDLGQGWLFGHPRG